MKNSHFLFSALFFSFLAFQPFYGQRKKRGKQATTLSFPEATYESLSYRSIGPFRGGRSAAVTGVPGKPDLFYFGATGGGVWKTEDITADSVVWEPASEGMGNVRVDMLKYRALDNLVLAATHGRGMFTTKFTAGTASIDEVVSNTKTFTIYPSISNGNFTVFAKSTLGNAKLDVFDISGRQVYTAKVNFSENEKQSISLNATNGIYIVNLTDEQGKKSSKKIVIQ